MLLYLFVSMAKARYFIVSRVWKLLAPQPTDLACATNYQVRVPDLYDEAHCRIATSTHANLNCARQRAHIPL